MGSRSEFGFIKSLPLMQGHVSFLGGTGNPSKKNGYGAPLLGIRTRPMRPPGSEAGSSSEPTESGMVTKRTEWLESQERKLTATLNEQRGEHQRLSEQFAASQGNLSDITRETRRLHAETERNMQKTQQLYMDQQWVYGKTSRKLLGLRCSGKMQRVLKEYRESCQTGTVELVQLAPKNKWVLLSYPMEKIDTESGYQYVMKMKSVDSKTGQLSMDWAIVYENHEGKEVRPISEFSVMPSHETTAPM